MFDPLSFLMGSKAAGGGGGGGKPVLPTGYKLLDSVIAYKQGIATGIVPDETTIVEGLLNSASYNEGTIARSYPNGDYRVKAYTSSTSSSCRIFGYYGSSSSKTIYPGGTYYRNFYFCYGANALLVNDKSEELNPAPTSTNQIYLFVDSDNINPTSGNSYFYGNVFRLRIKKNGEVVRDYIPALRESDNAAGLYDMVEQSFHTSTAETGWFVAGAVIPDWWEE